MTAMHVRVYKSRPKFLASLYEGHARLDCLRHLDVRIYLGLHQGNHLHHQLLRQDNDTVQVPNNVVSRVNGHVLQICLQLHWDIRSNDLDHLVGRSSSDAASKDLMHASAT